MAIDTIVAVATAVGRGAIGVVRVSGPAAPALARAICGKDLPARQATHTVFLDEAGRPIDDGLAIFFPAPHSYTGEDVLELQGHGGAGVMQLVLARCLNALKPGIEQSLVRIAEPGEFTRRAFLNDKIDLAQAEAVADLIEASSAASARSAVASLKGAFSQAVRELIEQLVDLRVRVEACLDFPEEDIEFIAREGVTQRLDVVVSLLKKTQTSAQQGAVLREGLRVVLVGAPNVGKSSLLNVLAQEQVSLVTDIAGTTRDRIVQEILIEGVPFHLVDTAGLRQTHDPVEALGIERTWQEIEQAQVIMLLRDASGRIPADRQLEQEVALRAQAARVLVTVMNKADLCHETDALLSDNQLSGALASQTLWVSATTGQGLDELRRHLLAAAGWSGDASSGVFSARSRHLDALSRALVFIEQSQAHLRGQELDLLAEGLRQAQLALSEITGEFSADDLLGQIFGRFCIGK